MPFPGRSLNAMRNRRRTEEHKRLVPEKFKEAEARDMESREEEPSRKGNVNAGLPYHTLKGTLVKEKTVGELCTCKRNCIDLVPQEERIRLHQEFWSPWGGSQEYLLHSLLCCLVPSKSTPLNKTSGTETTPR